MKIIDWNKPKKLLSTKQHNEKYMSESVPGTYVPNMSDEDKYKWKGKFINGSDKRVELRKTFNSKGHYAQVLITIRPDDNSTDTNVIISANGKIAMDFMTWDEFKEAIKEAENKLYERI